MSIDYISELWVIDDPINLKSDHVNKVVVFVLSRKKNPINQINLKCID